MEITKTLCKKHGLSGFFESCKHVPGLVACRRTNDIKIIRAYIFHMKVCNHCIEQYNLEKYIVDPDQEGTKSLLDAMPESDDFWHTFERACEKMDNRTGWCSKCYDELINNKSHKAICNPIEKC